MTSEGRLGVLVTLGGLLGRVVVGRGQQLLLLSQQRQLLVAGQEGGLAQTAGHGWARLLGRSVKQRKEMVYLTTHSTHFIYAVPCSGPGRRPCTDGWPWTGPSSWEICQTKEGNGLFNDTLNTFYLCGSL